MVYTRAQRRRLAEWGVPSQEDCQECSQRSSQPPDDHPEIGNMMAGHNMYRPNDRCKRHRLPDNADKNVEVISYRRRAPH